MDTMNYSVLGNQELSTFSLRAINTFDGLDPTKDKYALAPFVARAVGARNDFLKALERESKDPFTQLLAGSDSERDDSFYGVRFYLIGCGFRRTPGWAKASATLLDVIRRHGWGAAHYGYKAETGVILSILDEFKTKFPTEVALLAPLNDWITELEDAQKKFEDIQQQSLKLPETDLPVLDPTRPVLEAKLRELLAMTALQLTNNPTDTLLTGYIRSLNELISLTMTSAKAFETRKKNEKKKGSKDTPVNK